MMKVFISRKLTPSVMERALACPHIKVTVNPHDAPCTRAQMLKAAAENDILLTQLVDPIDEEVFVAGKGNLKLVANFAVGYNNIDVESATKHGVAVSNTPGVLTDCTADLTLALMLGVARRVVEGDAFLRAGQYKHWAPELLLGSNFSGKTIGIVGLGRIGFAVAQRCRGFGCRVLYSGNPKEYADFCEHRSLEDLLRESDFVSLHCRLDASTRHLIGEEQLKLMKRSAFLINAARGEVVDESALVRALKEGRIAGAGLDVYEKEPETAPGLTQCSNALLLPHLGSSTIETRDAMGNLALDNVIAMATGKPLPTRVN